MKPRAVLALAAHGGGLELYDDAGKRRAALIVTAEGPVLGLRDRAGKLRAGLSEDGLLRP